MARDGVDPSKSFDESDARSSRLENLLAEYIERLNAGEALDVEAIRRDHPDIAEDLLSELRLFQEIAPDPPTTQSLGTLGDYTLRRLIGRGGMGVVYEAWENSMDRRVALKVLPAGIAADPKACARFLREAQTAGKLSHPNVVPVFFTGIREQTLFYAMEFVEGETLAQVLTRQVRAPEDAETPFGPRSAQQFHFNLAEVFAGVADGLQHAHSKGVIHRDLKPSNLVLDRDVKGASCGGSTGSRPPFTLRILDFGLAHLEGQESLTASGDIVGTPLYMSPEQACRKKIAVDHRTDIYSLGATLYEMLVGRPPFRGKDHQDTLSQVIERDPVDPRSLDPRVPRELETIVLKCLRKDPAERYGTAEALAQDLRRFVRGDPVEARPESSWEKLYRRLHRRRTALLSAGVVCVLFLGIVGWLVWEKEIAEREARRILHDATVRDAAIDLSSDQFTLLGQNLDDLGSTLFMFRGSKFRDGPAGAQDTVRALERAAEAVPARPDAPYYLSLLYRLAGDLESAGREAEEAHERDPDFVPAEVVALEIALDRESMRDPGIEAILDRFRDKEGWQEPWLLAYKHVRSRAWSEAAREYCRLLEFREREPYVGFVVESLMGRGLARLYAEDFTGAISDFAGAHSIWPRLREASLALGVAWHKAGHPEEADRVFLELYSRSPEESRSQVAAWIAGVYENLQDSTKSGEWLDRVGGWERATINCLHFLWQGRYEECIEEARRAVDVYPEATAPLNLLAWGKLCAQWGRWGPHWDAERREILELARKSSALHRNDRYAQVLLALALQVNARPEEALRTIEGAIRLRLRTGDGDFHDSLNHGCILRLQGDLDGAEKVLLETVKKHPGKGSIYHELARTYELQGRYEEAGQVYRAMIEAGDASAQRLSLLAGVLNRLGRYEEAAEYAEKALGRLPKNTSVHEELAHALWKLGRSEEALEAAEAGIRELPGRQRLQLVKGRILEGLGRLEEAAKAYCLELDLRLDDAEAHEALGGLLRKRPDLASSPEVAAVAEAIERRRSAGSCGAVLLEALSLIQAAAKEGSGAPVTSDK